MKAYYQFCRLSGALFLLSNISEVIMQNNSQLFTTDHVSGFVPVCFLIKVTVKCEKAGSQDKKRSFL